MMEYQYVVGIASKGCSDTYYTCGNCKKCIKKMQYLRVSSCMHKLHLFLANNFNQNLVQLCCNYLLYYGCTMDVIICSVCVFYWTIQPKPLRGSLLTSHQPPDVSRIPLVVVAAYVVHGGSEKYKIASEHLLLEHYTLLIRHLKPV